MDIHILDNNLLQMYIIDTFESFIWTERYNGYGDFEMYIPLTVEILEVIEFVQNNLKKLIDIYVWLKGTNSYMIIETLEIKTDVETGNKVIISGRGLESILERRIVWKQTILNSSLQYGVKRLINESIISPTDTARKIDKFVFKDSTDEFILDQNIRVQFTGDNLYEAIYVICDELELGFNIIINEDAKFEFELVRGENRSYSQEPYEIVVRPDISWSNYKNPYVIFSPSYENLVTSDYLESSNTFKTITLVAGEDEGLERRTVVVNADGPIYTGLARRELYTDARDIQSETEEGQLSQNEYDALLISRGKEKLSETPYTKAFTGEISTGGSFVYGEDFFVGDVVQIVNEFGMETTARIVEVIRSLDAEGYRIFPTFQIADEL